MARRRLVGGLLDNEDQGQTAGQPEQPGTSPLGRRAPTIPGAGEEGGVRSSERSSERAEVPGSVAPRPAVERRGLTTQATPSMPTAPSPVAAGIPSPSMGVGLRRPMGAGGGMEGLLSGGLGVPGVGGPGSTDVMQTLLALLAGMPGR